MIKKIIKAKNKLKDTFYTWKLNMVFHVILGFLSCEN